MRRTYIDASSIDAATFANREYRHSSSSVVARFYLMRIKPAVGAFATETWQPERHPNDGFQIVAERTLDGRGTNGPATTRSARQTAGSIASPVLQQTGRTASPPQHSRCPRQEVLPGPGATTSNRAVPKPLPPESA